MIITETQTKVVTVHKAICCDRCRISFLFEADPDLQIQEFIRIRAIGGYGSKFVGDSAEVSVDLCEKCFYDLCHTFWVRKEFHLLGDDEPESPDV